MMLWNFLADEANPGGGNTTFFYILLAVLVVLALAYFLFSGKKNKQHQREYLEQIEAIRPGNKVKSAGGLCGVVVEVCDDNTVIIETGSEKSGKSFFKLDKESIYQTDAKGPTQLAREEAEARRAQEKEAKKKKSEPADGNAPEKKAPEDQDRSENQDK